MQGAAVIHSIAPTLDCDCDCECDNRHPLPTMAPHRDIELNTLNTLKLKEESLAQGSSYSMRGEPDYDDILSPKRFRHFLDGFKREPTSTFFPHDHLHQLESGAGREHDGSHYYDLRLATLETAHSGLARKLKGRHLQMIAIGGSIGTLRSPLRRL